MGFSLGLVGLADLLPVGCWLMFFFGVLIRGLNFCGVLCEFVFLRRFGDAVVCVFCGIDWSVSLLLDVDLYIYVLLGLLGVNIG